MSNTTVNMRMKNFIANKNISSLVMMFLLGRLFNVILYRSGTIALMVSHATSFSKTIKVPQGLQLLGYSQTIVHDTGQVHFSSKRKKSGSALFSYHFQTPFIDGKNDEKLRPSSTSQCQFIYRGIPNSRAPRQT